jgi:hypothetical protein
LEGYPWQPNVGGMGRTSTYWYEICRVPGYWMNCVVWGLTGNIVGQFLARFLKNIGHTWFVLHRTINIVAVILTVVGFIIIVVEIDGIEAHPHHIIGFDDIYDSD